jgi:hypothetical protein
MTTVCVGRDERLRAVGAVIGATIRGAHILIHTHSAGVWSVTASS